jgi:hypothetical protein
MAEGKRNVPVQAATNPRPGDFPLGSMQSRAAARFLLQGGALGIGEECICFPPDEFPDFPSNETEQRAAMVQCPLHGKRFDPRPHFFIPSWHWRREVKLRWPRLSEQYHKAFRASFSEAEFEAMLEQAKGEQEDD